MKAKTQWIDIFRMLKEIIANLELNIQQKKEFPKTKARGKHFQTNETAKKSLRILNLFFCHGPFGTLVRPVTTFSE